MYNIYAGCNKWPIECSKMENPMHFFFPLQEKLRVSLKPETIIEESEDSADDDRTNLKSRFQVIINIYYIPSPEILEFPNEINFDIITSDDINFHFQFLP